jgi:metal-responsive CopG/Arc/MetJ family transcriptional regulator
MPNEPDYEQFKVTTSFSITETARDKLQELAEYYGLKSRSDLLERMSRGLLEGFLWLNSMDKEILIDAIDYYVENHRNMITKEEAKKGKGDKEFVLYQSIVIAHLRLMRHRLMGQGENAQVDTTDKAYAKIRDKYRYKYEDEEE